MCLRASCVIFDNLSCMFSASHVSGKHNSALPPTHSGDKKSGWSEWLACYRASVFPDQSRLISGFSALLISGLPHTHYCRNWDTMAPVSMKCNHVIFLPLSLKVTAFHWFWLSPLSNTGKPYMWKSLLAFQTSHSKHTHTYRYHSYSRTSVCKVWSCFDKHKWVEDTEIKWSTRHVAVHYVYDLTLIWAGVRDGDGVTGKKPNQWPQFKFQHL